MNDQTQTLPAGLTPEEAKAAREWATDYLESAAGSERVRAAARVVLATVPEPRPTLADMTEEERAACKGMQADLAQGDRVVILDGHLGLAGRVRVLEASLDTFRPTPGEVTPRPDLPRLEWPGTEKPAPAPALPDGWRLADHEGHGRVIVTTPIRDGRVYFVTPTGGTMGNACDFCRPDELTYVDEEGDTSDTVPESTLAVGSEWGDADALAQACRESGREQIVVVDKRGTAGMWDMGLRCWRVTAPDANLAPYTIIHIGREADQ